MNAARSVPAPSLRHLRHLCDGKGLFEHAKLDRARPEHGYCTDDAGRALALASRLADDPFAEPLARLTLGFLEAAHMGDGQFRWRLAHDGDWSVAPPSDDASGRALLGLGVAAALAPWPEVQGRAMALFEASCRFRSRWPRAMAYATLGASEVLSAHPGHPGARQLVLDGAGTLPSAPVVGTWPWPEPRLTYSNALLPEAVLAAAVVLGREDIALGALALLDWLVDCESLAGRFSFTPVGGRGPGGPQPAFDPQPGEAWAMADACARAWALTGQKTWADAVWQAGSWFLGHNDPGVVMFDAASGGGYDGLEAGGANANQGAESTMAFVGTMLQVDRLGQAAASSPSRWETDAVAAPMQRSAAP